MTIITAILVPWTAWIFVAFAHSAEGRQARNLEIQAQTSGHHHGTQDASLLDNYNNNSELPRFAEEIQNVTVSVGRDALLACVVDNLRNYKVAWVRVDTQTILSIHHSVITQNPRISLSYNDHRSWYLHIKDAQEVDRGWYMCQVNTDPMRSRQGYIQVVVPPSIITKETSTDMVVREASNVTLTCKATGFPEPYVMWRREDGKNINYNGESVNVVDGEVLHIVKISRLHMGAYLCIASNGVPPSVSKRVLLRVQFPPMLSIPNQLEGAYIGQDVTLECHTEAYPNSINYWTTEHGDMIVSGNYHSVTGDKYEAVSTDNGYNKYMMLKIRNVSPKDFGSYKCVAQNSLGGTDGDIKLDEIPAPSTTSTMPPPYYQPTSTMKKNGRNGNKKSRLPPSDYDVEELRNPGPASMRPPGDLPTDAQSPGVSHRAQLVLLLSLSLLSLLLPAIRR
ncbi:lachesin-like isoform X2 [Odontomachus brunneus]|uniref:lachesin-like isoform X2 n=1 Tax=Odontomachus brunneus TaxID=486640 RepID=UPI0013F2AE66|nr:lachesin-like isoform X2 [Odontomachus brunneus]XP_032666588.1 lachesin-like isoform X2 [Odontomachus brunneus]XP_032666589.1 lachesin-like isoform X2 [Odontomachus brunneus]